MLKTFLVVFRYKTRPRFRKGTWKDEERVFTAETHMDALRSAKRYAEQKYRSEWVIDVCSLLIPVCSCYKVGDMSFTRGCDVHGKPGMTREEQDAIIREAAKEGF